MSPHAYRSWFRYGMIHAFTLVELLVVMSIIGLLMSLLLPVMKSSRNNTRRTMCLSNLHQIGILTQVYYTDYASNIMFYNYDATYGNSRQVWPFRFFQAGAGAAASDGGPTLRASAGIFQCPSDPFWCAYADAWTNYMTNSAPGAIAPTGSQNRMKWFSIQTPSQALYISESNYRDTIVTSTTPMITVNRASTTMDNVGTPNSLTGNGTSLAYPHLRTVDGANTTGEYQYFTYQDSAGMLFSDLHAMEMNHEGVARIPAFMTRGWR